MLLRVCGYLYVNEVLEREVNEVLEREDHISISDIFFYSCFLILINSFILYLYFKKKYKKFLADNQIDELTGVKIPKLWN